MTAKRLTVCPEGLCARKPWGKGRVKRLLGAGGGLIFKGSGFYVTDYRSEKYKEAAKKEKTSTSPSGNGKPSPSKTETKPAAAPKPAK